MDLLGSSNHSFIIRIWIEETAEEAGRVVWRGQIVHVPSGERRHVQDLDSITAFIAKYLDAMGVKHPVRWQVRQWLHQLRLHFKVQA